MSKGVIPDTSGLSTSARKHYLEPLRVGQIPSYLRSSAWANAIVLRVSKAPGGLDISSSYEKFGGAVPLPSGYQGYVQLPMTFGVLLSYDESTLSPSDFDKATLRKMLELAKATVQPYLIGMHYVHPEHVPSAEVRDLAAPVGSAANPVQATQTAAQKPFAAFL